VHVERMGDGRCEHLIVLGKLYGKRPFKDQGLEGKWILQSVWRT